MFVRWKRHKRRSRKQSEPDGKGGWKWIEEPRFLLSAALVRSERVNGKPRQRIVAYLASIRENLLGETWPRIWFWDSADKALAGLADNDRQKCEAALLSRVRRPTAEEVAAAEEERKKQKQALMGEILRCGGDPRRAINLFKN